MEKYLFNDGITGTKEVHSREELKALAEISSQPDKIKVWPFNSHEWISYTAFCKQIPSYKKDVAIAASIGVASPTPGANGQKWLKKFLYLAVVIATGFLVFNFTRIRWENAGTQYVAAARPDNMPAMDVDSLVWILEQQRGQKLDKSTRTNLRLRNTWPDRILLQATASKEISKNDGSRFTKTELGIDNTTGFDLDYAIVKLSVWEDNKISETDTFRFNGIGYAKMVKRELPGTFRGDSISVSFHSIRAKSFNFCYSASAKNEAGENYDKWFCIDSK
jgi:hypothetical protein